MARARYLIVCLVLLSTLAPLPARAQTPDTSTYTDPAGRFSVPVPLGWQVQALPAAVRLTDPDGAIRVHVVVLDAPDVAQGIAAAWRRVNPTFGLALGVALGVGLGQAMRRG